MSIARYLKSCGVELKNYEILPSIVPYSKIPAKVLRIIAERRFGTSSYNNKQDIVDALILIGYKDGMEERVVKEAARKLKSR